MKKYITFTFVLLFILAGIVACEEKEPQYEIYENHEISACGVDDPLINLDWLDKFITENKESTYNITIHLYNNTETLEDKIVIFFDIDTYTNGKTILYPIDPYSSNQVYTCSGERLFVDDSGEINSDEWDNFFYSGKNKSQGVIWYRRRIN
jgi:hypothetical protein